MKSAWLRQPVASPGLAGRIAWPLLQRQVLHPEPPREGLLPLGPMDGDAQDSLLGTSVNEVTIGWSGSGVQAVPASGESSTGSSRAGGHFRLCIFVHYLGENVNRRAEKVGNAERGMAI